VIAPTISPAPPNRAPAPRSTFDTVAQRARAAASGTPGRLRLASLAIVISLVVALVVTLGAVGARQGATRDAGLTVEPLVVGTQDLYGSLADADSAAADAFLSGGIEPAAVVSQYSADINNAADKLVQVTRQATNPAARADLQTISQQLPVYTGLIEAARANNRQNLPVGAAYLRQASTVMRTQILPAVNRVYQLEAARLHQRYSSAGAGADTIGVIVFALIALAVLIGVQLWLAGRTNRVFNLPLAGATILVLAVLVWTLVAFAGAHHSMAQAKRGGSDAVEVLARARSVALQASSDESLAIVARGNGQAFLTDFNNATSQLGGTDGTTGLLAQAANLTSGQPNANRDVQSAVDAYKAYLTAHANVRAIDARGDPASAVAKAAITDEYPRLVDLNSNLSSALNVMQTQFVHKASSARSTLSPLSYAVPILLIMAALLALVGIQQRINDYR
jgi:hypothetical protein